MVQAIANFGRNAWITGSFVVRTISNTCTSAVRATVDTAKKHPKTTALAIASLVGLAYYLSRTTAASLTTAASWTTIIDNDGDCKGTITSNALGNRHHFVGTCSEQSPSYHKMVVAERFGAKTDETISASFSKCSYLKSSSLLRPIYEILHDQLSGIPSSREYDFVLEGDLDRYLDVTRNCQMIRESGDPLPAGLTFLGGVYFGAYTACFLLFSREGEIPRRLRGEMLRPSWL